jgi:hypothetical protein
MLTKHSFSEKYPSRVEELDERRMVLAMPMTKGMPILLSPGTTFYGRVIIGGNDRCSQAHSSISALNLSLSG